VLDEAALRRPIGGRTVLRAQIVHLLEVSELPNVTLQVMPYSSGGHAAAGGPFTILRFAETSSTSSNSPAPCTWTGEPTSTTTSRSRSGSASRPRHRRLPRTCCMSSLTSCESSAAGRPPVQGLRATPAQ
jgi:hypothetical protein